MSEEKPKRKWITRKRVLWAAGIVCLGAVASIFLMPFILKYGVQYVLRSQGQSAPHLEEVYLNPFTGTLVVRGLSGGGVGDDIIDAGHMRVELDWGPLFQRRISIRKIIVEDVTVQIVWQEPNIWRVGEMQFDIAEMLAGDDEKERGGFSWGMGTDAVQFNNIVLRFRDAHLDTELTLAELEVNSLRTWDADNPANVHLLAHWEGGTTRLDGQLAPFSETGSFTARLKVDDIPLDPLASALAARGVEGVTGSLNAETEIALNVVLESLAIDARIEGLFSGETFAAKTADYGGTLDAASWEGTITAKGTPDDLAVEAIGRVGGRGLNAEEFDPEMRVRLASASWDGIANAKLTEAIDLNLRGAAGLTGANVNASIDALDSASLKSLASQIDAAARIYESRIDLRIASLTSEVASLQATGLRDGAGSATVESAGIKSSGLTVAKDGDTLNASGALSATISGVRTDNIDPKIRSASLDTLRFETASFNLEQGDATTLNTESTVGFGPIQIMLAEQPVAITQQEFQAEFNASVVNGEDLAIQMTANGGSEGIEVRNTNSDLPLLNLESVSAESITVDSLDNITVAGGTVQGIALLQRAAEAPEGEAPEGEPPHVATVGSVRVANIRLADQRSAEIDSVTVDGLEAWVARTEDEELEAMLLLTDFLPEKAASELPESPAEEGEEVATEPEANPFAPTEKGDSEFRIRLGKFELGGDTKISIRDSGVSPATELDITEATFTISDLDTDDLRRPIPVAMAAKIGEYSTFRAEGEASASGDRPSATIQASLQALDLPPLSGYPERFIGYKIETGVFSADMDIKVVEGELDTTSDLHLHKLAMAKLKEDELQEFDEQIGMPVNAAIDLLRDSDDNIILTIPVQGALDDPDIQIGSVIRTATANALKKGVMTVFAPLRLIVGGVESVVADDALAFKEIPFRVATAEFEPDTLVYLDEIAGVLKGHPGIGLTFSGFASKADIDHIRAGLEAEQQAARQAEMAAAQEAQAETVAAKPKEEKKPVFGKILVPADEAEKYAPPPSVETPDTDTAVAPAPAQPALAPPEPIVVPEEDLLKLAGERADRVKAYLVETGGIDPGRILVSRPSVDAADEDPKKPRVEISL